MSYGHSYKTIGKYKLDRPVRLALGNGTKNGRGKRGSIFVKSAGNGREAGDNCAFEEMCNSIFTITVGAIDKDHLPSYYSEACTSVLVSAYSDGLVSLPRLLILVYRFTYR